MELTQSQAAVTATSEKADDNNDSDESRWDGRSEYREVLWEGKQDYGLRTMDYVESLAAMNSIRGEALEMHKSRTA